MLVPPDTLGELGKLLRDAGQMNEAINAFNEALAIYRKIGDPVKSAIAIEFLGSVHERQGQYAAALAKYQEALALQQYGSTKLPSPKTTSPASRPKWRAVADLVPKLQLGNAMKPFRIQVNLFDPDSDPDSDFDAG